MVNHTDSPSGAAKARNPMSTLDPAAPVQRGWSACQQASECLMQGAMTIAGKQAELGQGLMLEYMTQWQDLTRPRDPDDGLKGELALARRQTERSIDLMRSFNDDVRQCCFEMFDAIVEAMSEANPTLSKPDGQKPTRRAATAA